MSVRSGVRITPITDGGASRTVVFVHGFAGRHDDTWDRFPGLLGSQIAAKDWDVHILGYPTTMMPDITARAWGADPAIPDLAALLRDRSYLSPLQRYEKLALVGHSMGGLLIQRALLDEPALAARTSHVVLFGTPSEGAESATWGRILKRQLANMARGGAFIEALRLEWNARFRKDPWFSFAFATVAGANDWVVPAWSSLRPFPAECRRLVPGNHRSMVKPSSPEDLSLRLLRATLLDEQPPSETIDPLGLASEGVGDEIDGILGSFDRSEPPTEKELVDAALALERIGRRADAVTLLEKHQDVSTDVQGTLAGRIKRMWLETDRIEDGERAFELYGRALAQAMDALVRALDESDRKATLRESRQVFYLAINVAFMEFVLHDRPDKAAEWAAIADEEARRSGGDIWSSATRAEAQLYLGQPGSAVDLYRTMFEEHPDEEPWKFESAGLQAIRVAAKLGDADLARRLEAVLDPNRPLANRVLVVYSEDDADWVQRFERMAAPLLREANMAVEHWVVSDIEQVEKEKEWATLAEKTIRTSGLAITLVSPDLLASERFWERAGDRVLEAAENERLPLFWAHMRATDWLETPLTRFRPIYDPTRPLADLSQAEQNEALRRMADRVRQTRLGHVPSVSEHEARAPGLLSRVARLLFSKGQGRG